MLLQPAWSPAQWEEELQSLARRGLARVFAKRRAFLADRRRIRPGSPHQRRGLLAAEQENQRRNGHSDGNTHRFSIGLPTPILLHLPLSQSFPFALLFIKRSGGLNESMNGIFLIQPQGAGIGPDKPASKNLIREIWRSFLLRAPCTKSVRMRVFDATSSTRQPLRLTHLPKKFTD